MQLKDFSIEKRIKVINIKSSLAYEDYLEGLKSYDYNTLKEGINAILEIEPEFFLINESFLDSVIEIISIYNGEIILARLNNLKKISNKVKDKRRDKFLYKEYLKRDISSYEDYLELLDLDDLLINEENYNYLLDNPYILHSISYLKQEFSDYYSKNRKADNYLLTILNILEKRNYYDTNAVVVINSILEAFPNKDNEKIITFAKHI